MSKELAVRSIRDLIQEANEHHNLAVKAARGTLEHVRCSGERLIALKAKCQRGAWEKLVLEEGDMALRTAQAYMKVAREHPKHEELMSPGQMANISITEGVKRISLQKKEEYYPEEPKAQAAAPQGDPVDGGTEECIRGGVHEYDAEACIKCHDPRPTENRKVGRAVQEAELARQEAARAAEAGIAPGNRYGGGQNPNGSTVRSEQTAKLFMQAEGHYTRLTQILDQLNQAEPYHEKEGVQVALSLSYENFSKWRGGKK